MEIIEKALGEGKTTLSEYESKKVLKAYEIPVTKEVLVEDVKDLAKAAQEIGYPLVLKGCSSDISHKTEKGLIRVDIRNEDEATAAFEEITADMGGKEN
ncbi:MAG: acetate--CoA ligase family protein, partial [Desulfobacterales bacterium]|nr:acetate--CoA ligase family protein [Desulfobacterales bacterium]